MTPFTSLVAKARRQNRIITLAQLRDLGYEEEEIRHLVRTERLQRMHRAVYALNEPLGPAGVATAAVLRCQPRAAGDRLTAAAALGLRDRWPAKPQVVTARPGACTDIPGIDLRRSVTLK